MLIGVSSWWLLDSNVVIQYSDKKINAFTICIYLVIISTLLIIIVLPNVTVLSKQME